MMMMCTIRRGEERAVGQRQILCRVVVVIRIIRAGRRTRKTAVLIKRVSPFLLERETRETRDERKRKERRIGTIQLHSLITRERILSCNRAYNRQSHHIFDTNTTITKKKKRKENPRTPPPPPHLARAVHHSEGQCAARGGQTQSRHLFFGRWWWCFDACLNE